MNRCIRPHEFPEVVEYKLHHLPDASAVANGAASYQVVKAGDGQVHSESKGRKCTPGNYEKYLGNKYEDPDGFEPQFLNSEVGYGLFAVKDFPIRVQGRDYK